jgi:hypothetical protein
MVETFIFQYRCPSSCFSPTFIPLWTTKTLVGKVRIIGTTRMLYASPVAWLYSQLHLPFAAVHNQVVGEWQPEYVFWVAVFVDKIWSPSLS